MLSPQQGGGHHGRQGAGYNATIDGEFSLMWWRKWSPFPYNSRRSTDVRWFIQVYENKEFYCSLTSIEIHVNPVFDVG